MSRTNEKTTTTWLNRGERGAIFGIRMLFFWATVFGRWPTRQFLKVVVLFYALVDRSAKRASREYLGRVHGRAIRWREVYAHIFVFAQVALDRIFLLKRKFHHFSVEHHGHELLERQVKSGEGAILLGAHFGSFEAMRVRASKKKIPVSIVGHFENAKVINGLLERIDPEMAGRVVHAGVDPMNFALIVRERLEQGHMVAILGDRVGLNSKTIEVDFLGSPAHFPTGPFLLASALKCPVYLVFGVYFEPNRYELHCEKFAESVVLERGRRQECLAEFVQAYANRLEEVVRLAPNNWFNFFDFWSPPESDGIAKK